MTRTSVPVLLVCALSLAGCGADSPDRGRPNEPTAAPAEAPVHTFADPLLEQKERARREVETVTRERKGNLDQAIDGADR